MDVVQNDTKGFSRRIKAHILGPQHGFAVIVPPELSPVCLKETVDADIECPEISDAGVVFSGRLKEAYVCNLWLRTASRVLCRLSPFRAGAVEELFRKVSRIPWELWLNPEIPLDIEAHVEYSRISHEGRVADILFESVEKSLRSIIRSAPRSDHEGLKQKLLVRLIENHCQISLDMSGSHLHQRGYRPRHTGAPLRETLAAAILSKSEWKSDQPLVDGMCGSGTFPIEAALISRKIAPGLGRDFLFQRWPSFQRETWEYLCRRAQAASLTKTPEKIVGIDIDPEALSVSAENANRAGVGGDIELERIDFFEFDPVKKGLKKGLLVLNPPYGIRLEAGGTSLYARIGAKLRLNFKGWKFAVLAGSRTEAAAIGMGRVRLWNIRHGGIPVTVVFGMVAD